jgi:hypothetical protein
MKFLLPPHVAVFYIAGLFIISAFPFHGGHGAWQDLLSVMADCLQERHQPGQHNLDKQLMLENQCKNRSIKVLLLGQEGSGAFYPQVFVFTIIYLSLCIWVT